MIHPDDSILQRYLDDDLPAADRPRMETHLLQCEACAARAEALAALVGRLHTLPDAVEPPTDLWPGIAERIRGGGAPVVPIERWFRRRPTIVPRWVAAVAAALLLGVALGRTMPERPAGPVATVLPGAPGSSEPAAAVLAAYDETAYDEAVADLEAILGSMRDRLAPETVRTLEENLAIIDRAIADSREALLADPANEHLHRHLATSMQTKLDLLRMVTVAVAAHI